LVGKKSSGSSSGRVLKGNWLKWYAKYTEESESPDTYHLWTGLSVLASAVRRNVWLNQGIYILYPHMFVILTGPPGRVGKSTTIRLGRTLLLGLEDIRFGPDSVTREELIRQLAKIGAEGKQSALTIHSTELSSLIQPSGINMIQFLTDIYDGDVKWKYATKGQGRNTIHNPVLNILAGTTPSWIAEGLPANVVGHGFTSRTIFVYEEEPRYLKPFPKEPDPALVKGLINDLDHISRLEGPFTFPDDAKAVYEKYYHKIDKTLPIDYRIEGYHWRKRVHLLKVAMLLSISETDDLVLRPTDIETAWDLLGEIERKMPKAFSAVGKYEYASDLERILAQIRSSKKMSATDVYNMNYAVGDFQQIAKIIQMLTAMGKIRRVSNGKETYYEAV